MNYVGPALAALVFVVGMSFLADPSRKSINAFLVAGACGVYISGGFGVWELLFAAVAMPVAYRGLRDFRFIGAAWLLHAAWDLPHHLWNRPIWPFVHTSSLGCMIFDSLIAIWFLCNAPPLFRSVQSIEATRRTR